MGIAKPIIGKVIFKGIVHAETALHIGGGREKIEIGGIDNAVLVDPITKEPYIPGSSLKGKMRSVLERRVAIEKHPDDPSKFFTRNVGTSTYKLWIHVCDTAEDAYNCPVCRVYGSSGGEGNQGSNFPSRIRVRDGVFPKYTVEWLRNADTDLLFTELKSENALDRVTAASNPRNVERVPAGADFTLEIVYDVEDLSQLEEDLKNILFSLSVIEDDYLGGMGSRGYGKVKFYFTEVIARRAEFYKEGTANSEKILFLDVPDVDRKTSEPPDYDELKTTADLIERINEVVKFFEGTNG